MQIDVGFNDVIHPHAQEIQHPTILEFSAATLRSYSLESVVAEKVEAMVHLARLNSRMKDFYDVRLCSRQYAFSGTSLISANIKRYLRTETQNRFCSHSY
jgi:predicted nucleotidyltransferase component of viral defense system